VLAIGQPSHAWVSGQLARAWGNERFGAVNPYKEVCLAAEQHDIGMADWDLTPARNPDTGLPRSFVQMPIDEHLQMWRAGPRRLVRQCRYAGLLAAMHGRRLYELRDLSQLPATEAKAINSFFEDQRRFEAELLVSLRADPATAPAAGEDQVARNSQLLWTWDFLSLALCLDWAPTTARDVPISEGSVDLDLALAGESGRQILSPWPFADRSVVVRCEGQRLTGRYDSDEALTGALTRAPWETLEWELVRP
jgi:hypothetical protein